MDQTILLSYTATTQHQSSLVRVPPQSSEGLIDALLLVHTVQWPKAIKNLGEPDSDSLRHHSWASRLDLLSRCPSLHVYELVVLEIGLAFSLTRELSQLLETNVHYVESIRKGLPCFSCKVLLFK